MNCPICSRAMTALFTSYRCDWCDYGPGNVEMLHRGYSLIECAFESGDERPVFRTRREAERWREVRELPGAEVREVFALNAYKWQLSRGQECQLVVADRLHEIYTDHRYKPLPYRAFLRSEAE